MKWSCKECEWKGKQKVEKVLQTFSKSPSFSLWKISKDKLLTGSPSSNSFQSSVNILILETLEAIFEQVMDNIICLYYSIVCPVLTEKSKIGQNYLYNAHLNSNICFYTCKRMSKIQAQLGLRINMPCFRLILIFLPQQNNF